MLTDFYRKVQPDTPQSNNLPLPCKLACVQYKPQAGCTILLLLLADLDAD